MLCRCIEPFTLPYPPMAEPNIGVWRQRCQTQLGQQQVPNLSGKNTTKEQVLYCLRRLSTEDAGIAVLEAVRPSVCRPEAAMEREPPEELNFWRCSCLPQLWLQVERSSPQRKLYTSTMTNTCHQPTTSKRIHPNTFDPGLCLLQCPRLLSIGKELAQLKPQQCP